MTGTDEKWAELYQQCLNATETAFTVEPEDGGVRLSFGDDPLDFIWQTRAQARDLADKLLRAISSETQPT